MRARESSYLGPILLNWDSTPARSPGNNRRPWLPSPVLDTRVQPDRESHSHAYHGRAEFLSRLRGWTRTGAVEEAFRRLGCRRWRCVASNEGTFRGTVDVSEWNADALLWCVRDWKRSEF